MFFSSFNRQSYTKSSEKPNLFGLFRDVATLVKPKLHKNNGTAHRYIDYLTERNIIPPQ